MGGCVVLMSPSSPNTNTEVSPVASAPVKPQPSKAPASDVPRTIDELEPHIKKQLETHNPTYVTGDTLVITGKMDPPNDNLYAISVDTHLSDNFLLQKHAAYSAAYEATVAAYKAKYASHLPIGDVAVSAWNPDGKQAIMVELGANVAALQPPSTWSGDVIGPTNFINFVKDH